jgi:hypothetical protein
MYGDEFLFEKGKIVLLVNGAYKRVVLLNTWKLTVLVSVKNT